MFDSLQAVLRATGTQIRAWWSRVTGVPASPPRVDDPDGTSERPDERQPLRRLLVRAQMRNPRRFRSWVWSLGRSERAVIDLCLLGAKYCDLRRVIEAFEKTLPTPLEGTRFTRSRKFLARARRSVRSKLARSGLLD